MVLTLSMNPWTQMQDSQKQGKKDHPEDDRKLWKESSSILFRIVKIIKTAVTMEVK